jgi:phosphoenolpyruvate synthase/pyruvate phosphate dikinase
VSCFLPEPAEGVLDDDALATRLAEIRDLIAGLRISTQRWSELRDSMQAEFGEPGTYGLFVRSDTNVEDLPQFTGAGLSETLPNIVDIERLFTAIPRVWSSVLSPRAIAWRSSLLTNPEEVYASVLLMKSVPSDKSGVMVTTNVAGNEPGLTVSTAWGVGGAVGGEATETIVLLDDGRETLVSEAKSAYQRKLGQAGGIAWSPANDGRVLTAEEKRALRELAREVHERYKPVFDENGVRRPWDIEFGFVGGELTLFQIRPLVERGQQLADRVVRALVPGIDSTLPEFVDLDELPAGSGGLAQ